MSDFLRTLPPMSIPLQKGRLGRGLASLIGEPQPAAEQRLPVHGEQRLLPIAELHPSGLNPRKAFDDAELAELANSIRARGLVQPIIARPDRERGGYEIVAGERRWRAAQRASMHNVPAIVRDLSDLEVAEFALIENVQRTDLNPIEEASGYNELIEKFNYTHEQLSESLGKSRSHVGNTLRLLKLPESVQVMVREGKLAAGAARAIVGHKHADVYADEIVKRGLNVRQVETLMYDTEQGKGLPPRQPGTTGLGGGATRGGGGSTATADTSARELNKDADTLSFEKDLSDALGLKVEVKKASGESGYLVIQYGNYDQLDYVRQRLTGEVSY
jgi:ParB family chromosome partitioning protein